VRKTFLEDCLEIVGKGCCGDVCGRGYIELVTIQESINSNFQRMTFQKARSLSSPLINQSSCTPSGRSPIQAPGT
jgi:hypothetical protein